MKLAIIFLSICVAMSHQQYFHPRMMMGHPWMSPFAQYPMYFNNYMVNFKDLFIFLLLLLDFISCLCYYRTHT
jgi:hypothetical protein